MMNIYELQRKLEDLRRLPKETEWVEFKHNNENLVEIGEYISAISNGAVLKRKRFGYLVWGIEDKSLRIVGTSFQPRRKMIGNEELENWLLRLLNPRIDFRIYEFQQDNFPMVMFEIQAANSVPIRFRGEAFIRIGSYKKKLKDYPEKERKLWHILSVGHLDWSAQIVEGASLDDLDPRAVQFALLQYREKHPDRSEEIDTWDNISFLNKAKICVSGKMTRAALLLLGREESSHFLSPAQVRIIWVLRDDQGVEKDYEHFDLPFVQASNQILSKIRNLTVRQLPSGTLFPHEFKQYDPWVIREILHNCIAHQDYTMGGRITIVETPEYLLFSNLGLFIPGTVEEMICSDAPPEIYRNFFLAQAMVNLNMIDTIGSGIKRMFIRQRERSFPMPDYELDEPDKVVVRLMGQVLDERYTRLLLSKTELSLMDVIALDKVQKNRPLEEGAFKQLKRRKLIEGRRPNLFVSERVAAATGNGMSYIKNRAFDKAHYKDMVEAYLIKFGEAHRPEFDALLLNKLSDTLSESQKKRFITNLLQEMRKNGRIISEGTTRWATWHISKIGSEENV